MNDLPKEERPNKKIGLDAKIEKLAQDSFLRSKGIDPKQPRQLEIWKEEFRELPNDFARAGLWSVRNKKEERQVLEGVVLFHTDKNIKVTYTGIELRADDDKLLYMQLIHYARTTPLGRRLNSTCTSSVQIWGGQSTEETTSAAELVFHGLKQLKSASRTKNWLEVCQ